MFGMQLVGKLLAAVPLTILISFSVIAVNSQIEEVNAQESAAGLTAEIYSAVRNASSNGQIVTIQYVVAYPTNLTCGGGVLVVNNKAGYHTLDLGIPCVHVLLCLRSSGTLNVQVKDGIVDIGVA